MFSAGDSFAHFRPIIPVITEQNRKANGQIGDNGKMLPNPLTVNALNRFGDTPKTPTEVVNALLSRYAVLLNGWDVQVDGVEVSLDVSYCFQVIIGDGSLVEIQIPALQNQAIATTSRFKSINAKKETVKIPLKYHEKGWEKLKKLHKEKLEKSPQKDKAIQALDNIGKKQPKSVPIGSAQGISSATDDSSRWQASMGLIFGGDSNNLANPVIVEVWIEGSLSCSVYMTDYNPDGGKTFRDVPKPNPGTLSSYPTFFAAGPSEVRFVEQNSMNEFVDVDYLLPWNVLDVENFANAKGYWLEAKLPSNEPATTTCGIEILDNCRSKLTNIPGAIAKIGANDIIMERINANDRYTIYRTSLLAPFVFINQTIEQDKVPPELPTGPIYVQTLGLARPFAFASSQQQGPAKPEVRVEQVRVRGYGTKKFIPATLSDLSLPNQREKPEYFSAQFIGMNAPLITLKYQRDTLEAEVIWSGEKPNLECNDAKLNYAIYLVDGVENLPTASVKLIDYRKTIIISGVQQGDKIIIAATVLNQKYSDKVAVVKGFTWNDLTRLRRNGKTLTFAPEFQNLSALVKDNIINTITFALEPPSNSTDPNLQTSQEKNRIAIRQQIMQQIADPSSIYNTKPCKAFVDVLAILPIPSAMAVGFYIHDDMYHCHFALSSVSPSLGERVVNYEKDWKREKDSLGIGKNMETELDIFTIDSKRRLFLRHYDTIYNDMIDLLNAISTSNENPFTVYHTYERHIAELRWPDYYVSPTELDLDKKRFNCGDPIRHIKTYISNNQPELFITENAHLGGAVWWTNAYEFGEPEGLTINFFINRKGHIVIFPNFWGHYENVQSSFEIADALKEKW